MRESQDMFKYIERISGYLETWLENTRICGSIVREYWDFLKDGERILGYVERW